MPWILGALVLTLMTVAILLQSSNLWKSFAIETASDTLLLYALSSLNFIAFIVFGFILLRSIIKLVRERRALQLGAKIKTRLLMYFVAISILPIFAMAVFSYLFMNRSLERWFTNIPENVINEARKLQARSATERSARLQESAAMIARMLENTDVEPADLDELARAGNLSHIQILSQDSVPLAENSKRLSPERAEELREILSVARGGSPDQTMLWDGRGFDAAVAGLSDGRKVIIVPNYQTEESVSHIADYSLLEFERLKTQQVRVRQIGLLTLGVLTFLLIFASAWTAFYIARGLTVPIMALAKGADEIARGNLSHRVDIFAEDELALLITTFNMMSAKLEENSAELEERRRYIETVLESLPTGVVSFDGEDRVSTINPAALNILKVKSGGVLGRKVADLVNAADNAILERLLSRAKRTGQAAEQTVLGGGGKPGESVETDVPVALIATALPDKSGAVLLIEDLSELIAAQRASAWREVARRMAHEIKNPLTPIQLSAERIARRFTKSGRMSVVGGPFGLERSADQGLSDLVDESTATILREVATLKTMVNEFSCFARLPEARLSPASLNDIITKVLATYDGRNVKVNASLAEDLPGCMLDEEQIKRVFVNLLENSIEASDADLSRLVINVRTWHDAARDLVVAEVSDNGKGISVSDFQKLFQPYFSTKGRGTGLGLAIVQRIISEHGGKIRASNNVDGGARFTIELPAA